MSTLTDEQREIVKIEVRKHLTTLRGLRPCEIGGASGLFIPLYRASKKLYRFDWTFPRAQTAEYVFCHGDLAQQNILVDPQTLKITAIVDWEYAGFWPEYFEGMFFERYGPSAAIGEEPDDSQKLLSFIKKESNPS